MNSLGTTVRDAAAVACLAFLLYLPTVGYQLVWDDPMLLDLTHARLQAGGVGSLLSSEFILGSASSHTGYFRPVVLLSLAVDDRIGGGRAWIFHFTNLLLHASVCGMAVLVLQRTLNDRASAIFGGLLFATHPVHVEAVAFVSGRTDLWAGLFVLLATALWMRGRGRGSVAAPFFLMPGALSKELAVMAVPAWLTWDLLDVAGPTSARPSWIRRNAAWLACSLVVITVVIALRWGALGTVPGGATPDPSALDLLVPRLATYLKLLVLPWPLSAFYTQSDLNLQPLTVLGALVAVAMFLALTFTDSRRVGAAGLSWVLLFLFPVLGVVSFGAGGVAAAERFLYVPSLGACIAAAALWGRLNRINRNVALATGGAVLVLFAGTTVLRSRVWRNEISLYTDMVRTSPRAFVAHFNLGNELARIGRLDEAEASLARAVDVEAGRADGWNNLGSVHLRLGKDQEAEKAYAEAVRLKPDFVVALRNWAQTLARMGRHDDAARAFAQLLARVENPSVEDVLAVVETGKALAVAGRLAEAENAFRMAIRAAPDRAEGYGDLGLVYLNEGKTRDAIPLLEHAVMLDPKDAAARFNLGTARLAAGDRAGAIAERDALRPIDPRLAAELTARFR